MSINEYMNLIVTAFYAVAFLIFLTVLPYMYLRKRRNIKVLESQIKSKIENGITLDPKLLNDFGKALGLGHFSSREPVYKLLLECNEVERFNEINDLLQKIKKEEPFDDMPDEVKPSLIRITDLVEKSEDASDKHLLLPINKILAKYVELEANKEKLKSRSRWSFSISVISILVGAWSLYQSPSLNDIEKIVKSEAVVVNQDNKPIKQD
ncbi:hypothetical protein [Shewanella glacialimarina]|uniref:hypothetical protein n=1 Tax=Shewanella glacialimarina TaxID=2590884 RepID=UPI001CF88990|nr:hypothetical protein [Shewanella glacialimarina]UCX03677.1 hypothetical protein FJ709_03570 [Shewanella glacialimarina]